MKIVAETPGIKHYAALGGLNVITFATKANSGTIFTSLQPWDERKSKDLQLKGMMATLQKKFAAIKEANILVISPPAIPGLGQTGGFTFELQQKGSTDDIKQFEKVVNGFVAAANKRPEIARAYTFFNARTPGYTLTVDRDKCKKLGLSIGDVYNTIQTYLGSTYVNDLTLYGRNFHVVEQADTSYRGDISDLNTYYVKNQAGTMVPLSTVISYKVTESAALLYHFNLFRSAEINGDAKAGFSSGQALQALKEVAANHYRQDTVMSLRD